MTTTKKPKRLTVRGTLKATPRRAPIASDPRWYWQLYYNHGGKQHKVQGAPSGRYSRAEVRAVLEAAWASGDWQTHHRAPVPEAVSSNTIGALLDAYLRHQQGQQARERIAPHTLASYRSVRPRLGELEAVHVLRIDTATLQRWVNALEDDGLAPSTVAYSLRVLRQAWLHGRARGWVPAQDLPQVHLPRPERVNNGYTPTYEEIASVREALPRRWHQVYLDALTETGARPGEVDAWRWESYRDEGRVLLDGKTGPRWVPMTARLRAVLDGWHAEQDRPDRGTVWRGIARPGESIRQALRRACPRAGVPAFTCYGCRRRVSSTLIDRIDGQRFGVHTYESWMGHSYEIGRRIYAEVCGERLDEAAAVLDEAQGVVSLEHARQRRRKG